jgi:sulfatase modifying factor 1
MKHIYACLIMLTSLVCLSSFLNLNKNVLKAKEIEKDMVQINEVLYVDKYEVDNGSYKTFLSYLINAGEKALYNKCIPDSTQWSHTQHAQLKDFYHSHSSYNKYPIVTISFEAANEYCNWLTGQYNSDKSRKFRKVIFRLPTENEWTLAASGGNANKLYPWGNYYMRNRKGEFLCNFLRIGDQAIYFDAKTRTYKVAEDFIDNADRTVVLTEVSAFPPTSSGLYNVSGNAAEMVAEKGLAKGGSYKDPGYDVRISSKKYYNGPCTEVGFRVLMEVKEK